MKKIILILTIILTIHTKAQTPIIDLQDWNGDVIPNMYIKDTHNVLNQFEGTWLYTNGTTSLKIVLVKKQMKLLATYYEDLIIGEHQYIKNGVEKFNSIGNLNAVYSNEYKHNIIGNHIHKRASPFDEVTPGEKILKLNFEDNLGGTILIRKKMAGSQEGIQILKRSGQINTRVGDPYINAIVPDGEYILIKQP